MRGPVPFEEGQFEFERGPKVKIPCSYAPEDHAYFPEEPEFWFSIRGFRLTGRPRSTWMIRGVYQGYAPRAVERFSFYDYHFQLAGTLKACTLSVSPRTAEVLHLTLNVPYDLVVYSHGLLISRDGKVVFMGHTDYRVDQTVVPVSLPPLGFIQTGVLPDHYKTCDFGYEKLTNTEITFLLGGERIVLLQGGSGRLGQYDIDLLVARAIEYPKGCFDCGICAISFVISRREGR